MRRGLFRRRRPATFAAAGILVLGLTIVLATTGAIVPSRPAFGSSTTLAIIAGVVDVRHGTAPYVAATDGQILQVGDGVRTGADGRAVLTYFEGSTVEIEPSSELVIEAASLEPDASTVIVVTQVIGHTWHVVTRQLRPTSRYEVNTPAATAAVRGTTFEVLVERDADGEPLATVLTTEGTVGLRRAATPAAPAEEVRVEAGREAAAKRGRPLEEPRPRREPQRVVTVTVGSERSMVVDPLGRANGLRDGKLVLQTPGAKVERIDGKLVITLPDVPEGKLAAHVERDKDDEVAVETRVRDRDRDEERAEVRTAVPARGAAVVDVEIRRGERPAVRARPDGQRASPSPTGTLRRPSPSPTGTARRGVPLPTVPAFASGTPDRRDDVRGAQGGDRAEGRGARSAPPRATTVPTPRLRTLPPLTSPTERPRDRDRTPSPSAQPDRGSERDAEPRRAFATFALPTPPSLPTLRTDQEREGSR